MKQALAFLRANAVGLALIALGLLGGFLFYRLTQCQTGSCPLTSTPYYTMFLGGLFGALAGDLVSAIRSRLSVR